MWDYDFPLNHRKLALKQTNQNTIFKSFDKDIFIVCNSDAFFFIKTVFAMQFIYILNTIFLSMYLSIKRMLKQSRQQLDQSPSLYLYALCLWDAGKRET